MNKKLELELVNLRIKDIKEQIQMFEAKLVDLENRRIELEKEIYEEEEQENESIDNPEINSEWASEDFNYDGNMPGFSKEKMQTDQEETNQSQLNLSGGYNEIEDIFESNLKL